jgi:hypothetical protein
MLSALALLPLVTAEVKVFDAPTLDAACLANRGMGFSDISAAGPTLNRSGWGMEARAVGEDMRLLRAFLSETEVSHLLSSMPSFDKWQAFSSQYSAGAQPSMSSRTVASVPVGTDEVLAGIVARIGSVLGVDVSLVDSLPLVRSLGGHDPIQ